MVSLHNIACFNLNNKFRVVHVYIPDFPVAISSFWTRAGSRFDPINHEGMAHFLEHLLTTRTQKIPNRQERLVEIERRGFLFNAHTGLETANYHLSHSPEMLNDAVDFLIDGYSNSIFLDKDIEEEKGIILDEEQRNRNDPKAYIWRLSNSAMWPDSMMGSGFYGNKQSLSDIIRSDVLDFVKDHYLPQNTVFVLINSIQNIRNQVKKIEDIKMVESTNKTFRDSLGAKKDIVLDKRDINYNQIAAGFITTSGSNIKDVIVLDLIKNYLASGWISRLITRARIENKLTYWINSSSEYFGDTGFIRFIASINQKHLQEFLNIFEEEILSLKNKKISSSILENHKNKYISDILRLSLDIDYLNWYYGSGITSYGLEPSTLQNRLEKIRNITPEQILEVANRYLVKNNFSLAVIGQEKEVESIPEFE